ncbi:MAG: flagellar export chaperone FlgN [Lachnospiraceae bacterium]|nr:flagellar export chaperone FlgN [Lachnospiraceae bacterium]
MADTDHNENYIDIMIESLRKKEEVLKAIIARCDDQAEVIGNNEYGDINWNQFNGLIGDKEILIDRLNELDDGFEALYKRIGEGLKADKDKYPEKVKEIQEYIRRVTDLGVTIRAKEERNRANLERVLRPVKKEIRTSKRSMSVINSYNNVISGGGLNTSSGWMDKKK